MRTFTLGCLVVLAACGPGPSVSDAGTAGGATAGGSAAGGSATAGGATAGGATAGGATAGGATAGGATAGGATAGGATAGGATAGGATAGGATAGGATAGGATAGGATAGGAAPPTVTILLPAPNATLTAADDASSADPGYQVQVAIAHTGTSFWSIDYSTCDASFSTCGAPVTAFSGPLPSGMASHVITVMLAGQQSYVRFIVTVDGLASAQRDTAIDTSACTLAFTNLPAGPFFNLSHGASFGLAVSLTGAACSAAQSVTLTGAGASITLPAASNVVFPLTLADGVTYDLEAEARTSTNAVVASTGTSTRTADFTAPMVAFTSPAHGATLVWNHDDDLSPATVDVDRDLVLTITDTNAAGGSLVSLEAAGTSTRALSPTNVTLPLTLVTAGAITLRGVTLVNAEQHVVTATARDAAGNAASSTFTVTVDTVPPAPVSLSLGPLDPRLPRLGLDFTAVGSNLMSGGPVWRYDVRYSAAPITELDYFSQCDGLAPTGSDAGAPAAPGAPMNITLSGPDPRAFGDACKLALGSVDAGHPLGGLYVAVRAGDDAGNWSSLSPQSSVFVSNDALSLASTHVRLDNTAGAFGTNPQLATTRVYLLGDVDGDGAEELGFGHVSSNFFCVVRGGPYVADLTLSAASSARHQCMNGAGAAAVLPLTGTVTFGHHAGALGDINADGRNDFFVTGRAGNEAFAFVYLGAAGSFPSLSAPQLRFRGLDVTGTSAALAFTGACAAGDFDRALVSGALTNDLALGSPSQGTVFVIPGSSAWTAATSVTHDLGTAGTPTALGAIAFTMTGATSGFGTQCARAGDVLPTPAGLGSGSKDDLLVGLTIASSPDQAVYLLPGRTWAPGTTNTLSSTLSPPTAEDDRCVRLRQDLPVSGAFSVAFFGNVDLTQDGVPDVVVTTPMRSVDATPPGDGKAIFIFSGARLAANVGADVRVGATGTASGDTLTGPNGHAIVSSVCNTPSGAAVVGDFNRWPGLELVTGDFGNSTLSLRTNHSGGGITLGMFPVTDGKLTRVVRSVAGGDFDGDGRADIAAGGLGELVVVH